MEWFNVLAEQADDPFHVDDNDLVSKAAWYRDAIADIEDRYHMIDRKLERVEEPLASHLGVSSIIQSWRSVDVIPVPGHADLFIQKSAAKLPEASMLIKLAAKRNKLERIKQHMRNIIDLDNKRIKREQRAGAPAVLATLKAQVPTPTLPKKMPDKLELPGMSGKVSKINNPATYYDNGKGGSPFDMPLHPTQQRILTILTKTLLDNKLKPVDVMYFGLYDGAIQNFVAYNADKSVVWRKYDVGGGSGQNWLYLNGNKMTTTTFTETDDAGRIRLLKQNRMIP